MNLLKLALILGLMFLLFAIQSFDWLNWQNSPCDFYEPNFECIDFSNFALNKFIRLTLNLVIIWLIQWFFFPGSGKPFLYLVISMIVFGAIDFYLILHPSFFAMRIHGFMHPLAFSPLICLAILAYQFIQFEKERS